MFYQISQENGRCSLQNRGVSGFSILHQHYWKAAFKTPSTTGTFVILSISSKSAWRFSITHEEIDDLEQNIIKWVQDYEKYVFNDHETITSVNLKCSRYYYQYKESRLSACPTVLHGLLHIAQNIRQCGPVWTTWTFHMERFCGVLKGSLHSRSQPWGNLNKCLLLIAYLEQLAARYRFGGWIENSRWVQGEQWAVSIWARFCRL